MQHRSIFQHNTVLLASIIAQLAESTLFTSMAPFRYLKLSKNCMINRGNFSLVEGFTAACSHNLPIYKWLGPALGSKVKSRYIIEHNVSIIQLPLEA